MPPCDSNVMGPRSNETRDHNDINMSEYKMKIKWVNVFFFIYLHASSLYAIYLMLTSAFYITTIYGQVYGLLGGLGITAGAHRLWTHRSYKARWPLRVLLSIFASIAGQNDIYHWCRDHRVHHKYAETDADPHNINRGFFFAHMGWLMCEKHPAVKEKGEKVHLDDLMADPVVRFQRRLYIPMFIVFSFYIPVMIPVWFWGESLRNSFFIAGVFRYCTTLHYTWLVNSAAHYFGDKPFDKNIGAAENPLVSFFAVGEGWHNYHHVFPWDYSTSELGYTINFTKIFIDCMALMGLAYDLKSANPEMIVKRKLKTGDGTRRNIADVLKN